MPEINYEDLNPFKSVADLCAKERAERLALKSKRCDLGVSFLNDATGGIYPGDLVLIGARTGAGKTELVNHIAIQNAKNGKKVYFFALETSNFELTRRIKYPLVQKHKATGFMPYRHWYLGHEPSNIELADSKANEEINESLKNLFIFQNNKSFTLSDFERLFLSIESQADLIIIDHIHYFDYDNENENAALKSITKTIRDMAQLANKPVVLVAHLRKRESKFVSELIPKLDDFHGSSDLIKIASTIILLAPLDKSSQLKQPTAMTVSKLRIDMSVAKYMGITDFDFNKKTYADKYFLGVLKKNNTEVDAITDRKDFPWWAVNADIPVNWEKE